MLCLPGNWTQSSSTFLFYSEVTSQVGLLQYWFTLIFKLSSTTKIWLIKAEKQAAHKQLMANVYNDPEHSEPFDITFPVPADRNVQVWIFETVVDQLSITAQEQAFQSTHSLYF